jgi:hypothetical protein
VSHRPPHLRPAATARSRTVHRWRFLALLAGLLLATGTGLPTSWADSAAPGSAVGGSQAGHVLDVTASNTSDGSSDTYALSTDHLKAGIVQVRLHNAGNVTHQVQLLRLHDGVTPAFYRQALLASQGGAALVYADATGGSNGIDPGGFQVSYMDLSAGTYVAMCFLSDGGDGAPHFAHGMFSPFTVEGQGTSAHPPGHVLGSIDAFSFGFTMPAVVDGHGLYQFTNTATSDTHEATLLRLAPGKHASDVLAWIEGGQSGPPPISGSAGGAGAMAPGTSMWVQLNLEPGDYVAVCFVPDDEPPHLPHAALGMVQGFTAR